MREFLLYESSAVPRHSSTQPTDVELQILKALWEIGPATVRDVHDYLSKSKDTDYATTVKMLRVMLDKGLVKRNDSIRPLVYRAAMTQEKAQKRMLGDLVDKLYAGSARTLVMHALSQKKASAKDLAEIRQLLDELEEGQ